MAKYSSADVVVKVDGSDGGALVNITQYVDSINGVKINRPTQDSHTFGDAWVEKLLTGIRSADDLTLEGFYDDTATTGPDAIFNPATHTQTRTVEITWGGTKTTTFEAWIVSYERKPTRGELTRFSVTLQPTGAVTDV